MKYSDFALQPQEADAVQLFHQLTPDDQRLLLGFLQLLTENPTFLERYQGSLAERDGLLTQEEWRHLVNSWKDLVA